MGFNIGTIDHLSTFFIGLGIAFLTALWVSLIIWVYRDIRKRSDDLLVRILAVTVSILLFIPGIFIYLIIRPSMTIEEKYQAALEEEALLATLEETELCPGCERRINSSWMICPACHTVLRKKCPDCGQLIELAWDICPFCSHELSAQKHERGNATIHKNTSI
ncbi:MAG: zinc ribbon domain-containing protein [Anaerolineaceae bacterium]|nr:zinc ribbon domain-containing protein [Anaerolineaceae bacterium]MBN2676744.1 zinc ribbon domain-containing protein [Anaerolineaceae bacterium]